MIACKQCRTTNSLDSLFCKHCGGGLEPDELKEAKSLLGRAVSQAFVLYNEGRVDEALAVAENALREDPAMIQAISLKGMCLEFKDKLPEALECYERVLDSNPDSMIDRVKVDQLRVRLLALPDDIPPVASNRQALMWALGAAVFMLAIGSLSAAMLSKGKTPDKTTMVASNDQPITRSQDSAAAFPGINEPVTSQPQSATAQEKATAPDTQAANSNAGATAPVKANNAAPTPTPAPAQTGNQLPEPTSDGAIGPKPMKISIEPDATPTQSPIYRIKPGKSLDPDPTPDQQTAAPTQQPAAAQAFDNSVIEINVSNPKRVTGGAEEAPDLTRLQALARTASAQFQLRHYESAAKAYERLLKSGADPAAVNQRLAQCYENLGRKADAVAAYEKAINSLEGNLKAGRGNANRQRIALDACRQAMKVLQVS